MLAKNLKIIKVSRFQRGKKAKAENLKINVCIFSIGTRNMKIRLSLDISVGFLPVFIYHRLLSLCIIQTDTKMNVKSFSNALRSGIMSK